MAKDIGAIYTPKGYAQIMTDWAIQSNKDIVLDMGVGPGVFVYKAYDRLVGLGARKEMAIQQIYGTEVDKFVFDEFNEKSKSQSLNFHNIKNMDFFDFAIPSLDVVIGNPPYVRRRGMDRNKLAQIRTKTLSSNLSINPIKLSYLSDLYIYFLLFALPKLKPGGRLATILADPWLNARYGIALKDYLLEKFDITQVVSLDRSVFDNADVKAVILLATKKSLKSPRGQYVRFARIKNGIAINKLAEFVKKKQVSSSKDIFVKNIDSKDLSARMPWGAILKADSLFDKLAKKPLVKPIGEVAEVRIGIETLARNFFVIPAKDKNSIEAHFLRPFLYSIHKNKAPVIRKKKKPSYYLFYCDKTKQQLKGTKALKYIIRGETQEVSVRGTDKTVIGYQNKDRIIKAKRPQWYDLKTECEKKEFAKILIPRFIYKEFFVLWNDAGYVPGGTVIQFFPKYPLLNHKTDIKVYLAILMSSFTEISIRMNAQVYGGGTSNLNINLLKETVIIDATTLSDKQKNDLVSAYDNLIKTGKKGKINKVIYEILELNAKEEIELKALLGQLRKIGESAKKAAHPQKAQ